MLDLHNTDFLLYNEYQFNNKVYASINSVGLIVVDIRPSEQEVFDTQRSIIFTQNTFPMFVSGVDKIIKKMYIPELFSMSSSGKLILNKDVMEKSIVSVQIPNGTGYIQFVPCIVYDDNDGEYEGVRVNISRKDIYWDIPISYMESLLYIIRRVDYIGYTLKLCNFVNVYGHRDEILNVSNHKYNRVTFENPIESKGTINGFVVKEENDVFKGIM